MPTKQIKGPFTILTISTHVHVTRVDVYEHIPNVSAFIRSVTYYMIFIFLGVHVT